MQNKRNKMKNVASVKIETVKATLGRGQVLDFRLK